MRRATAHVWDILRTYDTDYAEAHPALAAAAWGVWLLLPWWDAYTSTPSFRALALLIPEGVFGAYMLGVGACGLWALVTDRRNARRVTTLVSAATWVFVSALIIQSNYQATAAVIYPLLALSAGWAHLRLRWPR